MPLQLTVTRPPLRASRAAGSCQPLNAGHYAPPASDVCGSLGNIYKGAEA